MEAYHTTLANGPPEFTNYLENCVVHLLRLNAAAGRPKWTNNNCKSMNHVLVRGKYSSEIAQVEVIKAYCLSILVYSLGALEMTASLIQELSVCWNNGFRKIFRLHLWESVKQLQFFVVF